MIDDPDFDSSELFCGATELQQHERGQSFGLDAMTYFRLARCCNEARGVGVEPCVICRLRGIGERGVKVVLFGRQHAYELCVRVLRSCVTITVVAEPLDRLHARIALFETDCDDDRGWSRVLRSMTTAEGVNYVDQFWGEDQTEQQQGED